MIMKRKLIVAAIALLVIVGVLAYFNFVPFWASITTALAFIAGGAAGWAAKAWSDRHIGKEGKA